MNGQGPDKGWRDYFGFDLGDGESAVAWLAAHSRAEPQLLELRGRKSVISAVGVHPQQGVFIGEEALHMPGLSALSSRFKSRFLTQPDEARAQILRFARAVLAILDKDGRLPDPEAACFFIGCPSGWGDEARARYLAIFREAGIAHCEVVSESRAAFMFAREAGELRVGEDLAAAPTLIVDAGSSTTDFTFVRDLREQSLAVADFGEVSLGAGLIDRLLLALNVRRSPARAQIEAAFARFGQYAARCELEARRVKEMYFTQKMRGRALPCESSVKIYAHAQPLTLDLAADEADMREILTAPLPELGGRSYLAAFDAALAAAKAALPALPETILLTGGASRMTFIEEMCRHRFPDALVLRGLEPEFAIARGLCYALRADQRMRGFYREVVDFTASSELRQIVTLALPRLFEALARPLADALVDELAPQAFVKWREGALRTMDEIGRELSLRLREMMAGGALAANLRPAALEWIGAIQPMLEAMTDPICEKYGLAQTALRLPPEVLTAPVNVRLTVGQLAPITPIKALIDLIVAAIGATLLGGGGVALLAAGPAGMVAGFLIGLLAGALGGEVADKYLRGADLPAPVRGLFTVRRFRKGLAGKREDIARAISAQMEKGLDPLSEENQRLIEGITDSVERQLHDMARRATLRIH